MSSPGTTVRTDGDSTTGRRRIVGMLVTASEGELEAVGRVLAVSLAGISPSAGPEAGLEDGAVVTGAIVVVGRGGGIAADARTTEFDADEDAEVPAVLVATTLKL